MISGTLMFLDAFMERGLHTADVRWGDKTQCQFPLINSLHPLPLEWMYMVYLSMLIGKTYFKCWKKLHATSHQMDQIVSKVAWNQSLTLSYFFLIKLIF